MSPDLDEQNPNLIWEHKTFSQLTSLELHEILSARQSVFVVEQKLVCEDADKFDLTSIHLSGRESASREITAYARIHPPNSKYAEVSFGRVLITLPFRNSGLGKELVTQCFSLCNSMFPGICIRISAQVETIGFYEKLGFKTIGNIYMDAGIEHRDMLFELAND